MLFVVVHPHMPDGARTATVWHDVTYLKTILNWALEQKHPDGTRLLEANPILGHTTPEPEYVNRPLITYDRHLKLLAVADTVDTQQLLKPFLMLIEALGWRVSAIRQLRASDVDRRQHKNTAPYGRIHKRWQTDKKNVDVWVPMPESARKVIDLLMKRRPAFGDQYLFPAPRRKGNPWRREHARDLFNRAETAAELEPIPDGMFHMYRRKWATERKHLPDPDVMKAGGWKDQRTLQVYQQADEETMLEVMSEPRKLREVNE